jgi:PAS domain S-box-containing protein
MLTLIVSGTYQRTRSATELAADHNQDLARIVARPDDQSQVDLSALGSLWFDASPNLMAVAGFDGYFKQVNRAWGASLGYGGAALTSQPFMEFVHPEDQDSTANEAGRLAQGGAPLVEFDNRFLSDDGSYRWLSWTVIPIPGNELMLAVGRDITQRKRAEDDLKASREELALLNAQKESILRSAGEGIMAIDTAGLITSINPAAAAMLGISLAAAVGKRPGELASLTKADGSFYPKGEHVVDSVLTTSVERHVEGEILTRPDGTSIVIERIVTPLRNLDDTQTMGAVITSRDTTERARMERAKAEFLAMTSHELKTPLTAIHAVIGLVASGTLGSLPDKAAELLETASQNSDRLPKLTNEIVELERLNMGAPMGAVAPCDALGLLEEVAAAVSALAAKAEVELSVYGEPFNVEVDRDRIVRTLVNLVGNAIKFSPAGGEVVLACRVTGDEIEFQVRDSGPGIPAEMARQIFEPFQQVRQSNASQLGGSGLGLAISKGIIEQHGGRIWVESNVGEGSAFKFVLPSPLPQP